MIPAICYHRVGGPAELGVTRVARSVFARQMQALAGAGWRTVSLREFLTHVQRRVPASPREFLLSFDDGYANLADTAYPVLSDVGFTATTFLVTDFVGRTNTWDVRYTWRRLRHLEWSVIERWRGRGLEFGSHTATHARLTWLSDERIADELGRSRQTLLGQLGPDAGLAVAYPFGARDERIERLARAAGYELGFGAVQTGGSALALARVPVYVWDAGRTPLGLRGDVTGTLGRLIASVANRCAVGTSWMLRLRSAFA